MDNNQDLSKLNKILEKDERWKEIVTGFLSFFALTVIYIFVNIIKDARKDDLIIAIPIFLLFAAFIGFFWRIIYKHDKKNNKLKNHIKNWTVIKKQAEITEFVYYQEHDKDSWISKWYYIIVKDWDEKYESPHLPNAKFTGYPCARVTKEYYEENNLPMSLNDEKYLRSTDHRDIQFMEQRIKSLEEELKYTEDKSDKKRIKKEIKELENQKELKLPHHLISYGATFIAGEEPIITECYIWDKINLYISPDDPENYMIEI